QRPGVEEAGGETGVGAVELRQLLGLHGAEDADGEALEAERRLALRARRQGERRQGECRQAERSRRPGPPPQGALRGIAAEAGQSTSGSLHSGVTRISTPAPQPPAVAPSRPWAT